MDCGGKAQPRHRYRPRQGFPPASPPSPAARAPRFPISASPFSLPTTIHPLKAPEQGQAQSKTLRAIPASRKRASVLDCGGPPPLFPRAPVNRPCVPPTERGAILRELKSENRQFFRQGAWPSAKTSVRTVFACNLPRRTGSDAPCSGLPQFIIRVGSCGLAGLSLLSLISIHQAPANI